MQFDYLKALHIIFIVCWFAALFYIVRLFIYTVEAQKKEAVAKAILTEQLQLMQRKLWYIIGWPSMIGTFVFGFWMIWDNPIYLTFTWMWLKLTAVGLLTIYHFACQRILSQQKQGIYKMTSFKLRMFNEMATVLLVAIVFLVVLKSTSGLMVGLLGFVGFVATLMVGVLIYKRARAKSGE